MLMLQDGHAALHREGKRIASPANSINVARCRRQFRFLPMIRENDVFGCDSFGALAVHDDMQRFGS